MTRPAEQARYVIGIDLGTTHTVVAYADTAGWPGAAGGDAAGGDGGSPPIEIFAIDQLIAPGQVAPRPLLPSARYHPAEGELLPAEIGLPWTPSNSPPAVVGELALSLGAKVPGRLVTSAKSWLCHGAVDRMAAILPWGGSTDVAKVSPVEASQGYLAHVQAAWNQRFADHPMADQEVVLTVPASFDEAARALTVEAARAAGLERLRLVEEPQAAFYDFLDRHREQLEETLATTKLVLVCDVGGGTTDLSLIRVEMRDSGPRITRIAVGDHLMLGGDNMDLALAHRCERRLGKGGELGVGRFSQLLAQCRIAKERLLSDDAPDSVRVTVLGSGSKLVGAAQSAAVDRAEVEEMVLDGFLPRIDARERPARRRLAVVEFGLPYVADPAITRHIAAFLADHRAVASEALDVAATDGASVMPDAVLLNGGVFRGEALASRLLEVLGSFRGEAGPPRRLDNPVPELAVARGAAAYALARRGVGLRIGGGSPRTYFLRVGAAVAATGAAAVPDSAAPDSTAPPLSGIEAVCLLPRGSEEGEEISLADRTFSLSLGRPVRFHLLSSTSDVRYLKPGELVRLGGDHLKELPPIAAVLEADDDRRAADVTVGLASSLTEIGTLEMSCIARDDARRRWKLEFLLRGKGENQVATTHVKELHPRFAVATDLVGRVYGKSSQEVAPKEIKTLRQRLEKTLGPRPDWDTPLLREIFGALWAGQKRRRRSADHERVWFNLVGYALRPGFGYPLDEWRIRELWSIYESDLQFAGEAQNWAEWWILWRRVAGGLDAAAHGTLLETIAFYLEPPAPRPRKRPPGPKRLGYDDMVRLAGTLEHVAAERKTEVGGWLLERLLRHDENPQTFWALGRIGARVPFFGSAHRVVPRAAAATWVEAILHLDWRVSDQAPFAAALLARRSGDRERDLDERLRDQVVGRLEAIDAPPSWREMVREVTHLDAADERRVFGESLPPGLRLVD